MADKYEASKQAATALMVTAFESARDDFFDLLSNCIKITGLPEDVPERFVLKTLFENGQIGVNRSPEIWLPLCETGHDMYDQPTGYTLTGANGKTITGTPKTIARIRLNPMAHGILSFINLQSTIIAQATVGILQNITAIQNGVIIECADNETLLSLKNLLLQKTIGMPAIITRKGLTDGIKTFPTSIPYIAADLMELKKEVRDETLTRFGILTANSNKRERVQTAEVTAGLGETVDSVYTMIDTFNKDAEAEGITARMEFNGVSENMYEDGNTETENIEENKGDEPNEV